MKQRTRVLLAMATGTSMLLFAAFGYAIHDNREGAPVPIPLRITALAGGALMFFGAGRVTMFGPEEFS
jgi:hypothetical protein